MMRKTKRYFYFQLETKAHFQQENRQFNNIIYWHHAYFNNQGATEMLNCAVRKEKGTKQRHLT